MILFKQLVLICVLLYAAIALFLFLVQKKLIFFPTETKHDFSSTDRTPFSLTYNGAQLRGWLLNEKFASEKFIIYYGGNAEDIFYAREQFHQHNDSAVLLVNYRGYGISTGTPGEKELFADALAIYDDINRRYSPKKIYLIGRSLGSGVACYVAAHRKATGVVLITPFDSLESLARRQYPFLPTSLLLQHKFRSIDYISNITAPALILYGGKDNTVQPARTENLIMHMKTQKRVVFIEEAEHNNIELFDEYQLALLQFIQ